MTDRNKTIETQAAISRALLDHVMANYKKSADLIGENGMCYHRPQTDHPCRLRIDQCL